jgi:ATP-dependent Clp protease ATP-binding subunit ClpB
VSRVLVTGAGGAAGVAVILERQRAGHEVIGADPDPLAAGRALADESSAVPFATDPARKPYSVVLFDEIEKAHPDVFNVLLQVLDDGRLTDNKGRVANFKNTIIIMTSNIGSHLIQDRYEHMTEKNHAQVEEQTRSDLFELLRKTISPEFLNRIDEVIMFTPLTRKDVREIVKLQFNLIMKRIPDSKFTIEISEEAIDWLAAIGYDPTHGARPVKRMLQKYILNDLSREILAGNMDGRSKVIIGEENDEIVFRYA